MTKYTLTLKLKDSQDEYKYAIDLSAVQEDNPEKLFKVEIRENIRSNLQKQSSCKITDTHLNQMITQWIQDIKEGYRDSLIKLDLPSLLLASIANLRETGNQEIPALIEPDISEIEPCTGMLPPLIFS